MATGNELSCVFDKKIVSSACNSQMRSETVESGLFPSESVVRFSSENNEGSREVISLLERSSVRKEVAKDVKWGDSVKVLKLRLSVSKLLRFQRELGRSDKRLLDKSNEVNQVRLPKESGITVSWLL